MIQQPLRYCLNLTLLILMVLISACGATQTPPSDAPGSEGNIPDAAVVVEAPDNDTAKEASNESETAANEEETGIADLREFVDEIAPLPEKETEDADPTASGESGSDAKQDSSSSDSKTSTTDTQETAEVLVALADGGLQTVNVQTGSTLDILFEVDQEIALSTVSTAIGEPTETVDTSECPAGPLKITTWPNGLSINTLEETFVGWSVRSNSGSENLTTIAGVGIGSSLQDLQAAYDVEIMESSLGTEFNVGQMSGLLSSDQPDGKITDLWAGANCIFR